MINSILDQIIQMSPLKNHNYTTINEQLKSTQLNNNNFNQPTHQQNNLQYTTSIYHNLITTTTLTYDSRCDSTMHMHVVPLEQNSQHKNGAELPT